MELFSQLSRLYVNVRNDVSNLTEKASRPSKTGLSRDQAEKLLKEPLSDVNLQKEKVRAKIKEVQDERTQFTEFMACCSDLMNYELTQLDQLENHLQKYSVQPIGNARQRCESDGQSSVRSKQDELPSVTCNPSAFAAVSMATEPCSTPHVKEPPVMTYELGCTPNPADYGISETFQQHLDRVTAELLKKLPISHASEGQDQREDSVVNFANRPHIAQDVDRPLQYSSSPIDTDTTSCRDLKLDGSAILGHDETQGAVLVKKPILKLEQGMGLNFGQSGVTQSMNALVLNDSKKQFSSSLESPLKDLPPPRTNVRLPGKHSAVSDHLGLSSCTKSILNVLDLQFPSPPQRSDHSNKVLDLCTVARDKVSVSSLSEKKVLGSSTLLSEQTVNILHQLQMSKISASGTKPQLYSANKTDESIPADLPSTWKSRVVNNNHMAAKRCLDLGAREKTRDAVSSRVYDQNAVSTTAFLPKPDAAVTGQTYTLKGSGVKSNWYVTDPSSVLGCGDERGSDCKIVKPSVLEFKSEDLTIPQIRHFSLDEYESLIPAAVKKVVSLELINDSIGKANDVLLNKMLEGSSMTLSAKDLKEVVGSNASLFLKVMSRTGRLMEKTGQCGIAEYNLV